MVSNPNKLVLCGMIFDFLCFLDNFSLQRPSFSFFAKHFLTFYTKLNCWLLKSLIFFQLFWTNKSKTIFHLKSNFLSNSLMCDKINLLRSIFFPKSKIESLWALHVTFNQDVTRIFLHQTEFLKLFVKWII